MNRLLVLAAATLAVNTGATSAFAEKMTWQNDMPSVEGLLLDGAV